MTADTTRNLAAAARQLRLSEAGQPMLGLALGLKAVHAGERPRLHDRCGSRRPHLARRESLGASPPHPRRSGAPAPARWPTEQQSGARSRSGDKAGTSPGLYADFCLSRGPSRLQLIWPVADSGRAVAVRWIRERAWGGSRQGWTAQLV